MERYATPAIAEGVFWVGAKDWDRKLFDALIPLPQGTTYNAYLVQGAHKTALIDSVQPNFGHELLAKIGQLVDPASINYVVMNHAEPDHAGAIPQVMKVATGATLFTTEKGAKMAQVLHGVPAGRIEVIRDGDGIEFDGKTLRFIEAPWLHWPETMFTYLEESKVLFPCDFFGAHTAFGFFDADVDDVIPAAKRYFGEIMMPFRTMGKRAMEKLQGYDVSVIAPSHGPVYRNPRRILDAYHTWTSGETRPKVVAAYVSMWESTQTMVKAMAEALLSEGIEVAMYNLPTADLGDLAADLVDARALIFGSPAVLGGMHPVAAYAAHLVRALRPPLKYGVVLSSYGWGGGAIKQALEILGPTKIEVVDSLEVNGPPTAADYDRVAEIASRLAALVRG